MLIYISLVWYHPILSHTDHSSQRVSEYHCHVPTGNHWLETKVKMARLSNINSDFLFFQQLKLNKFQISIRVLLNVFIAQKLGPIKKFDHIYKLFSVE